MTDAARNELAPNGVLRAGINLANFLLVTGETPDGDPDGVSPDMAREVANRLGVPLKLVTFPNPGALADAAVEDVWDIGAITALFALSNRMAHLANMRPNDEFYALGRDLP